MMKKGENGWKVSEKKLFWRRGMKEGWYEMRLVDEEGVEVKMIGRRVRRFWSEGNEEEEEGL